MAQIPKIQWVISVLWPSFLVAGVATIVTFTAFDPAEISACIGGPEISRIGAYSLGFFLFWLMTSLSSLLTCYFQRPCDMAGRPDHPE
jgi:hypothetical protein